MTNRDVPEKLLPELNEISNDAARIPEKQQEENTDHNDEHRDTAVKVKTEKEESTTELDTTNEDDMSRKRKRKARPKKVMSLAGFPLTPKNWENERLCFCPSLRPHNRISLPIKLNT